MSRRSIREQIFKLLFREPFFAPEELMKQVEIFAEELAEKDADQVEYICAKAKDVLAHITEIDGKLDAVSEGWPVKRMGKAELTILRLGYYEMHFDEDIPQSVAINEAVELAKKYGSEDAPGFVNAILGKCADE